MSGRGRSSFYIAMLGAGVGFNVIGTYVLLTSEGRVPTKSTTGATENEKVASSTASLAPESHPGSSKPKRWSLW